MDIWDEIDQIPEEDYKENELSEIVSLARFVPLLTWKYDQGVGDDEYIHDGPTAQSLLNVPGLAGAVKQEEGIYKIDTKYIALAALSYIATLTRIITGIDYEGVSQEGVNDAGIDKTNTGIESIEERANAPEEIGNGAIESSAELQNVTGDSNQIS